MSKDKKLNPDQDLKRYHDGDGVSLGGMNFGLWLANNRRRLLTIVVILLIAVCAFFFIYSAYNYAVYFLAGNANDQSANESMALSPRQVTTDLEIAAPQIFKGDEHYDLTVKLTNPNDKFSANFNYCFNPAGLSADQTASTATSTDAGAVCGSGFILPGATKYVLALGQDLGVNPDNLDFKITNISWQRFDAHQIPNWNDFSSSRLDFAVSDINFTPAASNNLSAKIGLNNLEFNVKNQTAYGYYAAPLNILFFSGAELVGVNRYLLTNFLAGESRAVAISWPGNLRGVDRTEITPDINILDDSVYLKYQGSNPPSAQ